MKRGRYETPIHIPHDLTVEILKKLPRKSLVRFQCVSKLWSSTITMRRDFIDSIVTRSLAQPPNYAHLHNECFLAFSSTTCPRNTVEISILSSFPGVMRLYVRGLICCCSSSPNEAAIYNPTTRQYFYLPKSMKISDMGTFLFGYDPLENQYKVLYIPLDPMDQACQVFTLGDPTAKEWRTIQGVRSSFPLFGVVCINGAIYYKAKTSEYDDSSSMVKLMSFDVRSENFYHVEAPKALTDHFSFLINYQGKLGFVCCKKGMEIWVREDGDHQKTWSNIFFYEMEGFEGWRVSGVTRSGEIVFSNLICLPSHKLRVLYYDPNRNSIRYADLQGNYSEERRLDNAIIISTLPDLVENTMRLY